jgi:hypothetical protein
MFCRFNKKLFKCIFNEILRMVKKTGKPGNSTRAKALVSMAQQASEKYLEEIDVDMGDGYTFVYEKPSEASVNYAFEITKQNMQELYEQAPEWGWHGEWPFY